MAFKPARSVPGVVFVPGSGGGRKHPCKDCFHCQWCSDDRCAACLRQKGGGCPCGAARALLLAGEPGVSAGAVLRRVAEHLVDLRPRGFLADEVRSSGARAVDLRILEAFVGRELVGGRATSLYVVEGIGPAESRSPAFVRAVTALLDRGRLLLATVSLRGEGFPAVARLHPGAAVWRVTRENRSALPDLVLDWIEARL